MFAYDYDRADATMGEDDGTPSADWANPGRLTDNRHKPHPGRMLDYDCSATDEHFNATILSHAYWRFVQKVGHDHAGHVLHYVSWLQRQHPRFIDVYRAFVKRSADLYPSSSVDERARQAFRDEVGIGRDVPTSCTTTPHVVFTPAVVAAQRVRAAGLLPHFVGTTGSDSFVSHQSPSGGTVVARGTTVTLQLRDGPVP